MQNRSSHNPYLFTPLHFCSLWFLIEEPEASNNDMKMKHLVHVIYMAYTCFGLRGVGIRHTQNINFNTGSKDESQYLAN